MFVRIAPEPSISDGDFEHFLSMSAHCGPSVVALRPMFPRWRRRLSAWGITRLPRLLHARGADDAYAINVMTLLARQASGDRDPSIEHELRNLTRIRPFKS